MVNRINGRRGDRSNFSSDDDEEVGEELLDTGISVSNEELNFGIVERRPPNGPFATSTSSLTIKLADGFTAVNFLEERIRTSDGSDSACVKTVSHLFFLYSWLPQFRCDF
jgi:hypothetical protein